MRFSPVCAFLVLSTRENADNGVATTWYKRTLISSDQDRACRQHQRSN
jgi:predicted nuclease of restriction endonuclease-like (RecB) superfamily